MGVPSNPGEPKARPSIGGNGIQTRTTEFVPLAKCSQTLRLA